MLGTVDNYADGLGYMNCFTVEDGLFRTGLWELRPRMNASG